MGIGLMKQIVKSCLFIVCIVYAWTGLPFGLYLAWEYNNGWGLGIFAIFVSCIWIVEIYETKKEYGDAWHLFHR